MRSGFRGNEFHLADQNPAPGLIDAVTKLVLHRFELALPGFAIGFKLEAIAVATNRTRMRGEMSSDDGRPRAREPRECRVRLFEAANDAAEEFSCSLHEAADFSTGRLGKSA